MSPKTPPFFLRDELAIPERALTKEQHDQIVQARGRNYTDGPIARHRDHGSRPKETSPGDENARRIREDGAA